MTPSQPDDFSVALKRRYYIFAVLAVGYLLVYFHRVCPAVVADDMMKSLGMGGAVMGLLSSAYFYPYAAMQLVSGLLADSWGPRKTCTLSFCVAAVGSVILGLAPNAVVAIVGRTVVGVGVSMLFVSTLKILAVWFRKREFATMTGVLMALGGMGSLLATTPLAWMSKSIGWRESFVVIGLATLLLAGVIWVLVRNKPEDLGWPSIIESDPDKGPPIEETGLLGGMKTVLSAARFWPLAVWFFFNFAIFFSIAGVWGGPYLSHVYGMTKTQYGNVLSMCAWGMIIGSPICSFVSNRVGRKPMLVFSSMVVSGISLFHVLATATIPVWGLYVVYFILGVFGSAVVVVGFTTAKELFPVNIAGTSTGLINLFPFAGGAVFHPVLGAVLDAFGRVGGKFPVAAYTRMWQVLLGCALVALIASVFLKETWLKKTS